MNQLLPPRKRDAFGRFIPNPQSTIGNRQSAIKDQGGFDGANYWSRNRGYVYYPTLDSKKDLTCYDLYELRKRSRWLYNNSGFTTRCIDGIANMVGALTPVPQTLDQEWNLAALASFNRNAGNNLTFDVAGKWNFWSAQPMLTRLRLLDGDALAVLTESISGMASCQFYEAHQIDNSSDTKLNQDQWYNGTRTNAQGRIIGFRIVTGSDPYGNFRPNDNGQRSVDIPAQDAIFNCEFRRPGRTRGEPALRHAVNNLLDRSEIMAFTKTSIKNASMIGFQVVNNAPYTGGPLLPPRGMGAGTTDITVFDSVTGQSKILKAENPYGSGKQVEMGPGEEIKLITDERPHPNQVQFLDYLARDIAAGLGCSSDILWNMERLGGATVRYVMADAQQTLIEPAQELLADQFCTRFWIYSVAKEMKAGRLRMCQDPEWFKVDWQPQQKMTVDIGRDGNLYLDLYKSGLISPKRYFAQQGQNWQKETNDYLEARKYIIEKVASLGMTMDQAFPPAPGSANVQVQENVEPGSSESGQPGKGDKPAENDMTNKQFLQILGALKSSSQPSTVVNVPPINIPAPQIDMGTFKLPEQKAPIVNVAPAIITVKPAPPPNITVQAPSPVVVPPPIVNISAPPAPVVNVEVKIPKTRSVKFTRDDKGQIQSAETEKE